MTPRTLILAAVLLLPVVAHAQTCTEYATNPPTAEGCSRGILSVPGIWESGGRTQIIETPSLVGPPLSGGSIIGPVLGPPPLSADARAMAGRIGAAVAREMAETHDPAARSMLGRVLDAVAP